MEGLTMKLLTTTQAAAELSVTDSRIRQLAKAMKIGTRVGRDWVFKPSEIERLRGRKTTPGRAATIKKRG